MVIEVVVVMKDVRITVQNVISAQIRALRVMMDIIQVLLQTAHQNVCPDVKHALPVSIVHHARTSITTTMVELIVVIATVLKIVIVKINSVCHVRTDITIPVSHVIVYVQVTVSRVCRILIVDRVRMVIIKVTGTTT
jgi:hypothetical protein